MLFDSGLGRVNQGPQRRGAEDREDELPGLVRTRRGVIQIAGGATPADEEDEEGESEPGSLDVLLADLVSAPRNDVLVGRASFRQAPSC
jgi:hypothetical protein